MGWRIPSLFKWNNFLSHQLSYLTTVPHIHLAMATKPPQLIKASFTLYKLLKISSRSSITHPYFINCLINFKNFEYGKYRHGFYQIKERQPHTILRQVLTFFLLHGLEVEDKNSHLMSHYIIPYFFTSLVIHSKKNVTQKENALK